MIGAVSVALTSFAAAPAVAQDGRPPTSVIVPFCKEFTEFDPTQSLGECLGQARASEQAGDTKFCLFLKDQGFFDEPDRTMGDCVSFFQSPNR